MITDIGFTGTRVGMTIAQKESVHDLFLEFKKDGATILHHGMCIGADAHAHEIAKLLGFNTIGHPGFNWKGECPTRANVYCDGVEIGKPYIERDHDIVNECAVLVATPRFAHEERRSGTWATVRYARKQHKQVYIVFPDGRVKVEVN